MVKICEVVDNCEECPRYGDDCDGDKMAEHTDPISRADAIAYIDRVTNSGLGRNKSLDYIHKYISSLPSAELPKGDLISRALSSDTVQGFRGGKIPPKEMLDGTVLIPQHQWLEMERELANLKSKFESADSEQGVGRYENAMQKLREMPRYLNGVKEKQITKISADAVQGEWIWRTDIPIGDGRTSAGYICSNCGKDYWHGNVFDFCPNCGAYMKGGAE